MKHAERGIPADVQAMLDTVPGVVIAEVYGPRDDFGRVRFFSYLAEDIRWRGGGMWSAQAFHASVEDWATRHATDRLPTRIIWRERTP